jgi:hypothetical protein
MEDFMKLFSTLVLTVILSTFTFNAMAMDVVMIIPNILSGNSRDLFGNTQYKIQRMRWYGYNILDAVIGVPVRFLDEKVNAIEVNESDLRELAYSDEEIESYKADLNKIMNAFGTKNFSSKLEVQNALNSLDLGVIAREQLRLE